MLYWAIVCLVIAVIAGILGFGGIAGTAAGFCSVARAGDATDGRQPARLGGGPGPPLPGPVHGGFARAGVAAGERSGA